MTGQDDNNRAFIVGIYNCISKGSIDALAETLNAYVDSRVEQKLNKIAMGMRTMYEEKKNPYVTPDLEGREGAV